MPTLQDIRQQYPQYGDMSDADLASALHKKFYSDIPEAEFNAKIGLKTETPKAETTFAERHPTITGIAKGAGNFLASAAEGALNLIGEATGTTGGGLGASEERSRQELASTGQAVDTAVEAAKHPVKTANEAFSTPEKATESALNIAALAIPGIGEERLAAAGSAVGKGVRAVAGPAAEKIAARGEAKVAVATEASAERNQLITDVQKLGLRLTPQQAGGTAGRVTASVAGRPQLEREISLRNAKVAKRAAAEDVGIKGELTPASVRSEISSTLNDYKAPRKLGRVDLANDAKWQEDLKEIKGTTEQEAHDFPEDFNEKLEKEVTKFNKPSADADTLVTKIAKLRERAKANFRGSAEEVELARAQRKLATAMEEAIERHGIAIGQGPVIEKFRAARTRLAKLYTISDALTESGELDLGVLEKRLANDEPLTGNLRTLARAKSSFDRSFQNPEKIREHPVGFGDLLLGAAAGGTKAVAAGAAGAGAGPAAAALVARPVTRAVLASKPYQKFAIGPKVPKAGVVTRAARKIAGSKLKDEPPKTRKATLEDLRDSG